MGAGIAAHCANAGLRVTLLDLSAEAVRAGFDRMLKARPAALFTPATANLITLGTFTDDPPRVAEADWIVEAIVERLELKRDPMARLDGLREPDAVVSSNTSG
jgi:3-hydroxyacyl-CoA dehydrogenase